MIDWFTTVAQIINFAILVALLRYFLYDRIVDAMKNRESDIANRWSKAEQMQQVAAEELDAAKAKRAAMDAERERLMAEARQQAETHRRELFAAVRDDAVKLQERWAESTRSEIDAFLNALRRRTCDEVCRLAQTTLTELADDELERRIVARFLRKLAGLSDEERAKLTASLGQSEGEVVIQTSRPLPEDLAGELAAAARRHLDADLNVRFEEAPDLLCGVSLQCGSHKLAWDLRNHLAEFEDELQRMIEEEIEAKQGRAETAEAAP